MLKTLLSPKPISYETGLAIIRIFVGLMMAYHGWEVFTPSLMEGYMTWDKIKVLPYPEVAVYVGKGLELVTGICFTLGFLTRLSAIFMAVDMLFICFYIGEGRFYYQDQHPFLFALIAVIYIFTGPVKWSLDQKFFQ
ncbi:MAG TPA: DoxX family protein [Cyclobacteriaceae bacterium]|nr:DoxX family protein [Cyclobacteriaceae bacterium]